MLGLFRNLELRHKLGLLVGSSLTVILAVMIFALNLEHSIMLNDREREIKHLVETANSVVKYFYSQEQAGALSQPEAQKNALAALQNMSYADEEYFWVNDLTPVILMHPVKPELVGQNASGMQDANGKKHFVEMVKTVQNGGAGFVEYMWADPKVSDLPSQKISYVQGFQPWGWVIGTGLYIDDLNAAFFKSVSIMLSILVLALLAVISLSYYIIKSITQPLSSLSAVMSQVEQFGDLSLECKYESTNEIGRISSSFNSLISSFNQSLSQVKEMHTATNHALNEMTELAEQTRYNTEDAEVRIESISTAVTELVSVLSQVSQNTAEASNTTQEVNENTAEGKQTVDQSVIKIKSLAGEINQTGQALEELNTEVGRISGVTNIISEIAEQTNLLALNAAIEAARAGEQGRGFAVVADEVRTLSIRTQESTNQILDIIAALQQKSKAALVTVKQGRESADESVDQATSAGNKLQNIAEKITKLANMNIHAAVAAEEQEATLQQINREIIAIVDAVNISNQCATQTSSSSSYLKNIAQELQESIYRFKTA